MINDVQEKIDKLSRTIPYTQRNARQKENYNFHKLSAALADHGFNTLRLSDDWNGADGIALHKDGKTMIRIQLKGRLSFDKKYQGGDIWIGFRKGSDCYLYPHDAFQKELENITNYHKTKSMIEGGGYSAGAPSKHVWKAMEKYKV